MSTNTKQRKAGDFRGRLAGVIYTDAGLFEEAARAMGFTGMGSRSRSEWAVGVEVALNIDGEVIRGQVWARCEDRGYVWVALDGGRYVALNTRYGGVYDRPRSGVTIGRVAA